MEERFLLVIARDRYSLTPDLLKLLETSCRLTIEERSDRHVAPGMAFFGHCGHPNMQDLQELQGKVNDRVQYATSSCIDFLFRS